jgi:hypothetical protein
MRKNIFVIIFTVLAAFIIPGSAIAWGTQPGDKSSAMLLAPVDLESVHLQLYERCLQINPDGAKSFKEVIDQWGKKNYPALKDLRLILRNQLMKSGMSDSDIDKQMSEMTAGLKAEFANMPVEKFQPICSAQGAEKLTSQLDFVDLPDKYRTITPVQKKNEPKPVINSVPPSDSKAKERFIANSDGTVLDTKTNLMWAEKDNGNDIRWLNAKSYCENYREGGYTDWRMPTQDEIAGLYDAGKTYKSNCGNQVHLTKLIHMTCSFLWASETRGFEAAGFTFDTGDLVWGLQSGSGGRAIPVRSDK